MTQREIQLETLEVVKYIDGVCNELGIKYFAMYGTLIGAIRHHGFIPWDDDFDVGMTRKDYERFYNYMLSNDTGNYYLDNYKTNKDYPYYISRICDRRFRLVFDDYDYESGLFVDVYPFDGLGNTEDQTWWNHEEKRIAFLKKCAILSKYKGLLFGNSLIHKIGNIPLGFICKLMGSKHFFKRLEKYADRFSFDESEFVDVPCWTPKIYFFKKEWITSTIQVKFEDIMLPIPQNYDTILKLMYGDYMTPPPESKRVSTHGYKAYKVEE